MSKKLYKVAVDNTNTNIAHSIVISGRRIYGKSRTIFNGLPEQSFLRLQKEVLKTRFARLVVIDMQVIDNEGKNVENLSDDEKEVRRLLIEEKYDEAKILIDKINKENNSKTNADLYDSPNDMNKDIIESKETIEKELPKEDIKSDEVEKVVEKETISEEENKEIPDFDSMTKKELIKLAKDKKIELPDKISKKEILSILKSFYKKD